MRTVIVGEHPEITALITRRRQLGHDRLDEVWNGVLHMNASPAGRHGRVEEEISRILSPLARELGLIPIGQFNLGHSENNFRVPDKGYLDIDEDLVWFPSAVVVVEIVSPGDESLEKFDHFFEHGVKEVLVVDPRDRTARWWQRSADAFEETGSSRVFSMTSTDLEAEISWP